MKYTQSDVAFEKAQKLIPGGVNSPIRAFKSVRQTPPFIAKAKDHKIWDIDGNEYSDYCLSWGVGILGHSNSKVLEAVQEQLYNGTSYGAPTVAETSLAEYIVKAVPSIEKVRFVNSGTEAVMAAIRLARAYTGRNKIIKFDGCYHGHSDQLLINAGSGVAEQTTASSSGVTQGAIQDVISIPFQDETALNEAFTKYHTDIAAVIVEPVPGNMGVIETDAAFLKKLREITLLNKSLLIFDEVITGFRLALGGAQEYYGIRPDITTLGKIIGGGFPIGAFGANAEIMDMLAPIGPVYQAGTLSGNPVAVKAGIATMKQLFEPKFYAQLNDKAQALYNELAELEDTFGISINSVGSMFSIHFNGIKSHDFKDLGNQSQNVFATIYKHLLVKGVYLSPSIYETNFISICHSYNNFKYLKISLEEALEQSLKKNITVTTI
jgi:glutamate-1-semialdehyde 2,1-aminomutase